MNLQYLRIVLPFILGMLLHHTAISQCSGNPPININLTPTNASCAGVTDGAIATTATGGSGNTFGYTWSNGATTDNLNNITSGSYTLIVSDTISSGGSTIICRDTATVVVGVNSFISIFSDTIINESCGQPNGAVNISVAGAVAPFSFAWSNGATTEDIDSLATGTYRVTVTDASGCQASNAVFVSAVGGVDISLDSLNNSTCDDPNGAIFISDTSGVACFSPTVVINEFFVNPAGPNDGADPNTEEFVELMGPPGTDIGCYVLTDGDWTITIPAGTIMPADGIFSIGNDIVWGAGTFDLDAENCNCFTEGTGGNGLLIFTNGGEHLSIFDSSGVGVQHIVYGTPSATNTPPLGALTNPNGVIYTASLAGCVDSVTIPTTSAFEISPTAPNGTSLVRNPDGTGSWVDQVGGSVNACNFPGVDISYNWTTGDTTQDVSGLIPGNYGVTVTDKFGCTDTATYTITSPPAATNIASIDSVSCNGGSDGSIALTTTGAAPFTYLWAPTGDTTANISGLIAGEYLVTTTNNNGCTSIDTFTVLQPALLTITTDTIIAANCNTADGAAFISVFGGTSPYTYFWSNTATSQDIINVTSGNYTVTVTDNNGCTATTNITVGNIGGVTIVQDSILDENCGDAAGAVFVTTTGGTAPISYLWSNSATTEDITGLTNGNYSLSVTDNSGCVSISNFTVGGGPSVTITIDSITNQQCGTPNGAAYISTTGGTPPLSYLWSNGATTENLLAVNAANYGLTVTDAAGCIRTSSALVNTIGALTITLDSTNNPVCNGDTTGTIYISTADTTQSCFSSTVVINEFFVNPADANDGVDPNASEYIELLGPAGTDISCYVLTDGDWTITLPAGSIIPADGIFSIGNDAVYGAGTFDLDAENCNCFTDNTAGGLLIFSNGGEHLSLFDATGTFVQGIMYGNPTNNNAAPIGSATPAAANGVISTVGLVGCVNSVTIPDSNSMERILVAPANGESYSRNPNGSGSWAIENGGSINSCNFVGNNTITYTWSNGDTTQDITGLGAGIYTVTVTDAAGCNSISAYTITEPSVLVSTIDSVIDASCAGVANGEIYTSIAGGTGPYNFLWSNTNNTDDLINLTSGSYSLTVTDGNGCTVTNDTTVGTGIEVIVLIDSIQDASCNGGSDGIIYTTPINGTAPYAYAWSNNTNAQNATGLAAGTYVVTATDANGCTATNDSTVAEPTPIILNDFITNVSCGSNNDGSVAITPSGGIPGYTYQWNATANGQTTATATGLNTNTYGVTVTDANNCTVSGNGYFVAAGIPVDSADVPLQVDNGLLGCDLASTGALSINTTGTYTYTWSNGATTQSVSGLPAGTYNVTITNGLGCFEVQTGIVSAPFVPSVNPYIGAVGDTTITTITGTPVVINGGNDQTSQGVTYSWTATPTTGISIDNSTAHQTSVTANVNGNYTLLVTATSTNAFNCTDTGSVTMLVENNYIGMPDAFTPNGDGVNDLFRPVGLIADDIVSFRIYNRFGNLVYEGDDLANDGWDGTFNGVAQPREVYIYTLVYKTSGFFQEKSMKGRVTLLR